MAVTHVQHSSALIWQGLTGTQTVTMPGNFTSGSTGVFAASVYPQGSISAVTINGVTATQRKLQLSPSSVVTAEIWVAENLPGGGATAAITVSTAEYMTGSVIEFSGLATASYDTGATNSGSGSGSTTSSVTSPTLGNSNEAVIAVLAIDSGQSPCITASPGSPWTSTSKETDGSNFNCGEVVYGIVSSTSAVTASWTTDIGNGGVGWAAAIVGLKAPSGGGTTLDVDVTGDTIAATDGVSVTGAHLFAIDLSDSLAITDALANSLWKLVVLTDTADTADSVEWDSYSPADSFAIGDSLSGALSYGRGPGDSAAASDSASTGMEFGRAANDSISTSDGATAQITSSSTLGVQVGDSCSAGDSLATEATCLRVAADSASASDAVTLQSEFVRVAADSASTSDTGSSSLEFGRTLSDACTAGDAVAFVGDYARSLSDTAAVADDIDAQLATPSLISVSVSDSLTASDSLTEAADYIRAASDSADTSDASVRSLEATRTASDSLAALDTLVLQFEFTRAANDNASITDDVTVEVTVPAVISVTVNDSVGASDALITEADYRRALSDAVAAVDSVTVEIVKPGNPPTTPGRRGPVRDVRDSTRMGPIKRLVNSLQEAA